MDSKISTKDNLTYLLFKNKQLGVNLIEQPLSLLEIFSRIKFNCVPLALLDWNIILNGKLGSFQGHFIPITGYDEYYVYVHQPGGDDAQPNLKIHHDLFEKARKSRGTDEDILFVYK